jgi:hypothetical protein
MDIESLKEALGDEKFSMLKGYVDDLTGQRDAARNESINGRKGLKEKLTQLESAQSALLEKLGLDSLEELETLPDARGAAEAAKQYEAKLKRLERQYAEAAQQREEIAGKYKSSLQKSAIADALSGHEFIARDIVETFVSNRLAWEGDDLLYKADDGRLVPVKDGVAAIAKTRPELLKPTGTGGAGVRSTNAGGSGGSKTMTRAEFESMAPAQKLEMAKSGVQLI